MSWFTETISQQKKFLAGLVEAPMGSIAAQCSRTWDDVDRLDACLVRGLAELPHCNLLYALGPDGVQVSSNASPAGVEKQWRGQDLASRPYLQGALPYQGFLLSNAYLSQRSLEPCISAMHAVRSGTDLSGFLVADFDIKALSHCCERSSVRSEGEQFKGDPSIRMGVFTQQRTTSAVDENIELVLSVLQKLILEHGIFHVKLHFSSARATFWEYDNPYNYRLHNTSQIIDPALFMVYPRRPYPDAAMVKPESIPLALKYMQELRSADDVIYLRSGSINTVNGMVGLNFSCDGSHYMSIDEFLNKEMAYWFGR